MLARRPARAGREWSVEECAAFSAMRAFKLAELLAPADRRVMAAARRLHAPYGAAEAGQQPVVPPVVPPPGGRAGDGGQTAPVLARRRRPRRLTDARRAVLQAKRDKKTKLRQMTNLLQVLHLVGEVMRKEAAAAMAVDPAAMGDAAAMPPPPPHLPPSSSPSAPPPSSPSVLFDYTDFAASLSPPRTPGEGAPRDERAAASRSRTPSDASTPGSAHGGSSTPSGDG